MACSHTVLKHGAGSCRVSGKGQLLTYPARPQLRPARPRQRSAPDVGLGRVKEAVALGIGLEAGDAGHGRVLVESDRAGI